MQLKNGEITRRQTPVGIIPTEEDSTSRASTSPPGDLEKILSIDVDRWRQEIEHRQTHLEQFDGLPKGIWEAHHRVAAALDHDAKLTRNCLDINSGHRYSRRVRRSHRVPRLAQSLDSGPTVSPTTLTLA
jgi:Phosphoenolpyruvate carboxykinase C-terminal P-loop domain